MWLAFVDEDETTFIVESGNSVIISRTVSSFDVMAGGRLFKNCRLIKTFAAFGQAEGWLVHNALHNEEKAQAAS